MKRYKENLARLKKQLLTSRFLRWWLDELATMTPGWLLQTGQDVGTSALVGVNQNEITLSQLKNGIKQEIARLPLNASEQGEARTKFLAELDRIIPGLRDITLVLPGDRTLRKSLVLPLATEENLYQVLEFQMEQHTPFSPTQIYFGYRVTGRDFESGNLTLEFVASPRAPLDETMKTLAELGVRVCAVVAEDMQTDGAPVNLLATGQEKILMPRLHGARIWLAGASLMLLLAALLMPVVIKREAVIQMNPWVEKGRKAAEATDVLRQQLSAKVEEYNYLLEKKKTLPPVIMALEELSRILPDDTWVQQVDIKGKELQIQGETASSSRLISLFEQSRYFRDASFRSPLTKGQSAGTERYHLALEIHPLSAQAVPASPATAPAAQETASAAQPAAAATVQKSPTNNVAPDKQPISSSGKQP